MQITQFEINTLRTEINVSITDAADISSLVLFTNSTFKDFSQAIDLSGKLTASATETFTITLADLGQAYFDGLYFLEAEDTNEVSNAITGDFTRYKECILNKLKELVICDECLKAEGKDLLNAQTALLSLETATTQGFIDEAFNIIKVLDKFCSNDCKTCGEYNNIVDNNYYTS